MPGIFTINSPALPKSTHVVGFRGSEGISRPYAFEIHLALPPGEADAFELPSAVGAKATLTLDRQDGRPPFAYHGIFSEVAIVHHEPDGRAFVRAMLVPKLWRLTQTLHSRLFTQKSIPDILKKTLEDGGLGASDYRLQLTGQYATEEHVCQYRESHFDFISRWMEREGIYYFFEHGDDGEQLVIADDKSAHADLPPAPVRFFALLGHDVSAGECLQTFICRQRALPASVRFKDYDHAKPSLDVSGTAPVSSSGVGEINVHGARFFTPDAGKRLAKLRAQEMLAREQVFTGSGTAFFLRAGYTFDLHDHPRSGFDAKYLVTEVEHFGNQSAHTPAMQRLTGLPPVGDNEVYRVEVTAIPASVQFRAEQRAPWPRIYGTEHGTVDGEADSQYAQLDDHGRYLVRFAFDESDLADGKASTRVRMMQPHGGGVEGWHFPLRKGTEVLLTFLGGDPDRPVIAGVAPNTEKPSPVTKANHTRNVIQTGGRNRLEIEDKEGFERITWTTPYKNTMIRLGAPNKGHEMKLYTDGHASLDCDDWDITVSGEKFEQVSKDVTENYLTSQTTLVTGPRTDTVTRGMTQKITGGRVETITGGLTTDVSDGWIHNVAGGGAMDIDGGLKTTITGDAQYVVTGSEARIVASSATEVVAGSVTTTYGGPWTGIFPSINWVVGGDVNVITNDWSVVTPLHFETKDTAMEWTTIAIETNGLLVEGNVMHLEHAALHTEVTGVHVESVVLQSENVGKHMEVGAIQFLTFGLIKM